MTRVDIDLGFEITFNTQHGKNAMFFIMMEFLGGWQLEHENGTCYDQHLIAIYDAIKTVKIKEREAKNLRDKWEGLNGFYHDETGNLYCNRKSCYDCRRVFKPVAIDVPRMCGQMLLDGVKDAEVFKDTACKHFFAGV